MFTNAAHANALEQSNLDSKLKILKQVPVTFFQDPCHLLEYNHVHLSDILEAIWFPPVGSYEEQGSANH